MVGARVLARKGSRTHQRHHVAAQHSRQRAGDRRARRPVISLGHYRWARHRQGSTRDRSRRTTCCQAVVGRQARRVAAAAIGQSVSHSHTAISPHRRAAIRRGSSAHRQRLRAHQTRQLSWSHRASGRRPVINLRRNRRRSDAQRLGRDRSGQTGRLCQCVVGGRSARQFHSSDRHSLACADHCVDEGRCCRPSVDNHCVTGNDAQKGGLTEIQGR